MKIKGKALVEVEIDPLESKRITVQTLKEALSWPDEAYIDQNGNLSIDHMGHTSHSFRIDIEIVRKATEEDFALSKILEVLYSTNFKKNNS